MICKEELLTGGSVATKQIARGTDVTLSGSDGKFCHRRKPFRNDGCRVRALFLRFAANPVSRWRQHGWRRALKGFVSWMDRRGRRLIGERHLGDVMNIFMALKRLEWRTWKEKASHLIQSGWQMSVRRDATGEFLAEGYFVPAATAGKHSSVTQLLRAGILPGSGWRRRTWNGRFDWRVH